MQKKQFPMARSSERQRQQSHSEESAVSYQVSLAQKKEAEFLRKRMEKLISSRDMISQEVLRNGKKVQEYEASKQMDAALEAKTMYQKNFADYKCINQRILKISERLIRLYKVKIGPQMKNYVKINKTKSRAAIRSE